LAIAINTGRILLRDPFGRHEVQQYIDVPFCKNQTTFARKHTMDCFYESWSNCTMEDAYPGLFTSGWDREKMEYNFYWNEETALHGYEIGDIYDGGERYRNIDEQYKSPRTIRLSDPRKVFDVAPNTPEFKKLIQCHKEGEKETRRKGSVFQNKPDYWYSVAAAYLVRPNSLVKEKLHAFKANHTSAQPSKEKENRFDRSSLIAPYYPYNHSDIFEEKHCIAAYMRHGDKYKEMTLVKQEVYEKAADWINSRKAITERIESYGRTTKLTSLNESGKRIVQRLPSKILFFGTEDPFAIDPIMKW
jgi:hypothetical protein